MGFFTAQTKTVDLGGGNTAVVRKLTFGEHQAATSRASHVADNTLTVDYPKLRVEVAQLALVSWDGPGFEDRPPTPENVAALPVAVGGAIADAALELLSLTATEGE